MRQAAGSRTLDGEIFSFWCSVCEKQEDLSFLLTDNGCGRTGASVSPNPVHKSL